MERKVEKKGKKGEKGEKTLEGEGEERVIKKGG